jgi:protein-S-isoprenylcysteine O-methyltransferase Ste14
MNSYLLLILLWVLFGLSHSLLAAEWWKGWVASVTGVYFRYYRLIYSFIALFLLVVIVVYELQLPANWLWRTSSVLLIVFGVPALAGLLIMGICIRRYFFYLSGIDVLFPAKQASMGLATGGLNRYVRHPLYFGTLLAMWSFFVLLPAMHYLVTCCMVTVYTWLGAVLEEKKLRKEFGEEYTDYQRRVPMLIPFKMKLG